jgi:hypothetical protein
LADSLAIPGELSIFNGVIHPARIALRSLLTSDIRVLKNERVSESVSSWICDTWKTLILFATAKAIQLLLLHACDKKLKFESRGRT